MAACRGLIFDMTDGGLEMNTLAKITESNTEADAKAAEQVARAAYAYWLNQRDGHRAVAAALAQVAQHAQDPAVRHWAAGDHPAAVLEVLDAGFRQWLDLEKRAMGR